MIINCKHCNTQFKRKGYKQKFCSQRCATIFNNKNRRKLRHCKLCNVELITSRTQYCSNKCQQQYQRNERIIPKIFKGLVTNRSTLKKFLIEQHGKAECFECSIDQWRGHRLPLELDHIDGNALNNKPDNLRLLCPNCHSITPTWKNKNRGKGRRSLGIV